MGTTLALCRLLVIVAQGFAFLTNWECTILNCFSYSSSDTISAVKKLSLDLICNGFKMVLPVINTFMSGWCCVYTQKELVTLTHLHDIGVNDNITATCHRPKILVTVLVHI